VCQAATWLSEGWMEENAHKFQPGPANTDSNSKSAASDSSVSAPEPTKLKVGKQCGRQDRSTKTKPLPSRTKRSRRDGSTKAQPLCLQAAQKDDEALGLAMLQTKPVGNVGSEFETMELLRSESE
jgi:hypothetical protein